MSSDVAASPSVSLAADAAVPADDLFEGAVAKLRNNKNSLVAGFAEKLFDSVREWLTSGVSEDVAARKARVREFMTQFTEFQRAFGTLRYSGGFNRFQLFMWALANGFDFASLVPMTAKQWHRVGRRVTDEAWGNSCALLRPIFAEYERTDRDGNPVLDDDGNPVVARFVRGFRVFNVYDLSQTEGEPFEVPELDVSMVDGEAPGALDALCHVAESLEFPVFFTAPSHPGAFGETVYSRSGALRQVRILPSLSEAAKTETLGHELGHVVLHALPTLKRAGVDSPVELPDSVIDDTVSEVHKGRKEVEAEMVGFMVASLFDVDVSDSATDYIMTWGGSNPALVVDCLDRAADAFGTICKLLPAGVIPESQAERAAAQVPAYEPRPRSAKAKKGSSSKSKNGSSKKPASRKSTSEKAPAEAPATNAVPVPG